MNPEEHARKHIDQLLEAAGWVIQDNKEFNLGAAPGVAIREFSLTKGFADYALFVDRKAVGVIEAKKYGTPLSGVEPQVEGYLRCFPEKIPQAHPVRFAYASTGIETFFTDILDPDYRSRRVFAFHKPETLQAWLAENETLRARLRKLPALNETGLRDCQVEAITNLERSFEGARPRALIQMATGSGKTFTAVSFAYRLIKFANAKRILFLVDRSNLGRQTLREFQQYVTPDDGRKFTELYNVQRLTSNTLDPVNRVCITTIQRLYSMLSGEPEPEEISEEASSWERPVEKAQNEVEISYNPSIPIETFDFIVTDECHRSIYNLWRQVLEYFDSFIVGLTATPSKQTFGFFDQNLVMEYSHERAVADGVNVGFELYRIKTKITESGSIVEAGNIIDKRDRLTRKQRWEQLDEDLSFSPDELDRDVVAVDQIRTIVHTFKERLFTDLFPERQTVPKTLIFAKNDLHAEDIVRIVRQEFDKGNEFCKKITYKTSGESPETLIASFRNSYDPRIAVTVDMISTGTDIKPLECLLFMRDVKSRIYYEQMLGRGTRVISSTDLNAVTPDVPHKTHFVVVDAVGVTQTMKTDSRPLERKPSVSFDKLIDSVAFGSHDNDTLSSLAARLAALDREIDNKERQEIVDAARGRSFKDTINALLDAIDPDKHEEKARALFNTTTPTGDELRQAREALVKAACDPFDDSGFRNTIKHVKRQSEQIIDIVSKDALISSRWDPKATEIAENRVRSFEAFIEKNKDEIAALQLIYSKPYSKRHITFKQVEELAGAIQKPPYNLRKELLWEAYERLCESRVRKAGAPKLLTDIISLVRFAIGESDTLEPFAVSVERRFGDWVSDQAREGHVYTPEQMEWLGMIKDHIITSAGIDPEDFDNVPFEQKGGRFKAWQLFGKEIEVLLAQMNEALIY
jgi:type I restriction enzyme R subunit